MILQEENNYVWDQPNNNSSFDNMIRNVKIVQEEADVESEKQTFFNEEEDDDDKEQQLRQELIQRATTRLRRRLLEQGLQDVMSQVVSLQTQLETLRLDAATTIDTISGLFDDHNDEKSIEASLKINRQMDVLERRLESHKSNLVQFNSSSIDNDDDKHEEQTAPTTNSSPILLTASMSRLSSLSLVSSIFGRSSNISNSSRATSVSDQCFMMNDCCNDNMSSFVDDDCISHIENITGNEQQQQQKEDHPFYDLAGKRSFKEGSFCGSVYYENEQQQEQQLPTPGGNIAEIRYRRRQRRQRHQKHMEQQQYMTDTESLASDNLSSYSSISNFSNIVTQQQQQKEFYHPLSPVTPPPHLNGDNFFENHIQQDYKDLTHSWLNSANYNDCIQQQNWSDNIMQKASMYPERNVLDEAMSFLDGLGEDGDDGGFGEDMYLLLRNPDLCCRPLSEIENTMQELRQKEHQQYQQNPKQISLKKYLFSMMNPAVWCKMGIKLSTDIMYKATCSSLQWCRFLSVLSAAVVISLLKGPEDVRRHSAPF